MVAFAGVISVAVVGKTLAAPKRAPAVAPAHVEVVQPSKPEPVKVEAKPQATAPAEAPKASADPAKGDEKKAEEKKAEDDKKAEELKAEEKKAEEKKAEEKKAEEKKAEDKKAEDKKAEEKKAEDKKAEEVAKPSGGDAEALKKETLSLLNRGKTKDAIAKAREAVAADPSDAMPYLYLGSALQDSGKWKDGIEAYSECVRHATKGPVHECRAMGGRK